MRTGEVQVQAELRPPALWLTIQVTVRQEPTLAFVLDTGSPLSAIRPETKDRLSRLGLLLDGPRPGRYTVPGVSIQGQAMPDLGVRVLPRLSRLQIDGLIGLDYLSHFESIHFHVPTLRLTFQYPG